MALQKIFICYSRVDASDFALKLAEDLHNAGADIFIDRLSIPEGANWDKEIERALAIADCVLFIISEKSIHSDYVLNEVHYALEEKKKIIPIILHTCKIPLNVIRLQHIDFTHNYETGLSRLITALYLDESEEKNDEEYLWQQKKIAEPKTVKKKPAILSSIYNELFGMNGIWVFIFAGVYIVLFFVYKTNPGTKISLFVNDSSYTDPDSGYSVVLREVVPPKYDKVEPFSEGIAKVQLNNKWGYIDNNGKEVTPLKYDDAASFKEGMASVLQNGMWGFVNKNGKEITALKYDEAGSFSEGLAKVKSDSKEGFIDKSGKEVIPLKYKYAKPFKEGLAAVYLHRWGFIDKAGKVIIPLKYESVDPFSEGLARVTTVNYKQGFIDKNGKIVIPLKYEQFYVFNYHENAYAFSEGMAIVRLNNKFGFINKFGKEVTPLKYQDANTFSEGMASVKLNKRWGFINKVGKEVTPFKYEDEISIGAGSFNEGLAKVTLNRKFGFIDKNGKEVIPVKYDEAKPFKEGLTTIRSGLNAWELIDKTGKVVFPSKHYFTDSFSEGLIGVSGAGGWGFLNKNGKALLMKYDYVSSFSEGLAGVKLKDKWGYVKKFIKK